MSRPLDVDGPFGRFSRRLLSSDLPDLPAERLDAAVAFVSRRAEQTPGPLRMGLIALALLVGCAERFVDPRQLTGFLAKTTLPLVGELARMVRSLGFAFIWESWPSTTPTGASGEAVVA